MRQLGLWVVVAAIIGVTGCGGGSSSSTTATTTAVTISPTATQTLTPNQTVTFTATVNSTVTSTGVVTNITSTGVTWEVDGTVGGAPTTGTISTTGVFTAPATVNVATSHRVSAVSVSDTSASASTTVDLVPQPEITIAPTMATVPAGQTQTFTVTYSSTVISTNQVVNWFVNGSPSGQNTAFGQVSAAGVYTPPQVPPSGPVTVTAVLQSDTSQTASATVTDTYGLGSLVNSYAFLIRGETTLGRFLRAGTFTADGKGNITGGIEDINGVALPSPAPGGTSFTGTYSVGADGRGTMLFNDGVSFGSNFGASASKFSIVIASAQQVQVAESDVFASGSGEADMQSSSPPSATAFAGTYVFDFSGTDASANPLSRIGEFNATAGGAATPGGAEDINDNGVLTPNAPVTTFSYSLGATGGRSTATLVDGSGTKNFSFYELSAGRLRFIEIDAAPAAVVGGDAVAQSAPNGGFNLTDLGRSLLAATSGINSSGAVATVASFSASGTGALQPVTVTQNNVGTVTQVPSNSSNTYTVAPNGRGTIALGTGQLYVFYLIASNQGVIQETDQVVSSTVCDGAMILAYNNPPPLTSLSASIAMQWTGAGTAASSPGEQDAAGQFVAASGTFKSGTLDSNTANGNNVSSGFIPTANVTLTPATPYLLSTAGAPLNVVVGTTNLQFAVFFTSPTEAIILRVDVNVSDKRTLSGVIVKQF